MRMSFLPGDLHLTQSDDGTYRITMSGQEVYHTRTKKSAITRFKELRQEMEARFPSRELSAEEKASILREAIGDSLLGHNSLGGRKKKTTAGSTRTFGG